MTEALFLDTDCLSTFLVVGRENLVLQLYAGRIAIPQQVYEELSRVPFMKSRVDTLWRAGRVKLYEITADSEDGAFYLKLTTKPDRGYKIIGRGEAAAITLAKRFNGILGSNNLRDILPYIQLFKLQHRTSAMILAEAFDQHLISEGQGNSLWREMTLRNRIMPADSFTEFLKQQNSGV